MRSLPALWVCTLLSLPAFGGDPVCDDDFSSCREGCVLELGTGLEERQKVLSCIDRCSTKRARCVARRTEQPKPTAGEEDEKPTRAAPAVPAVVDTGVAGTPRLEQAPPEAPGATPRGPNRIGGFDARPAISKGPVSTPGPAEAAAAPTPSAPSVTTPEPPSRTSRRRRARGVKVDEPVEQTPSVPASPAPVKTVEDDPDAAFDAVPVDAPAKTAPELPAKSRSDDDDEPIPPAPWEKQPPTEPQDISDWDPDAD